MESARQLRDKAARYLMLSQTINAPSDIAWLEGLALEATQAAERIEAEDVVGVADGPVTSLLHDEPGAGAAGDSVTFAKRDVGLEASVIPDRRRPDRRDDVSPALIPLLREDSLSNLSNGAAAATQDDLSASRGIVIWALISAAAWVPLVVWIVVRSR